MSEEEAKGIHCWQEERSPDTQSKTPARVDLPTGRTKIVEMTCPLQHASAREGTGLGAGAAST